MLFIFMAANVSRVWRRAAFPAGVLFLVLSFKFSLLHPAEPNRGMRYDPLLWPVIIILLTP
jgi:hypothetical protein